MATPRRIIIKNIRFGNRRLSLRFLYKLPRNSVHEKASLEVIEKNLAIIIDP